MPICYGCGEPSHDHHWTWYYCFECGRHLCRPCHRRGCCGHSPAIIEDYLVRKAERVEYRLERVRGHPRVSVVAERYGNVRRLLTPETSLRYLKFAEKFDWGNERLPLRWSVQPLPCRRIDYTWRGWSWFAAASRISAGTRQLALALLLDFYRCEEIAICNWDRFAFRVLLFAPRDGAVVTRRDFVAWSQSYSLRLECLSKCPDRYTP